MIKNIKFIIIIFFSLFIFFIFLKGLEKPNNYLPEKNLNKIETNLLFKKLHDQNQIPLEDLINNNNFSIINIWASWCLPCRDEHVYLINLKKINNLNIIGVSYRDKKSNAIKFLNDLGNPYSDVLLDKKGQIAIDWGVYGIPETFVVNSNGIIKYRQAGPITKKIYRKINSLIKEIK